MLHRKPDYFQPAEDDLSAIKGILFGLIISLSMWAGMIAVGIYLAGGR